MGGVFDRLAELLVDEVPVVLATIVEGAGVDGPGGHLLVRRTTGDGVEVVGSLGDPDLDRVVARDH